jgi:hypothetical protein
MSDSRPCGSEGCYLDLNDGYQCKTSCSNNEHYSGDSRGICTLISTCESRNPINSVTYPCGYGCVYDSNEFEEDDKCKSNCPTHYINVDGKCEDNNVCETRSPLQSNTYPCGSGCKKHEDGCVVECPIGFNNTVENGICIAVICSTVASNKESCGHNCLYDPVVGESGGCSSSCTDSNYYKKSETENKCVLKDCSEILVDFYNDTYPCGPGECY